MKTFKTVVFLIFMAQSVFSQDINKCRDIVKIATEAISTKSTTELENYLSPNFEIINTKGEEAIEIVNGLMKSLNETVVSYNEVSSKSENNLLTLKYLLEYTKIGKRDATFVFDTNNKLVQMELIEFRVEKICTKPNEQF